MKHICRSKPSNRCRKTCAFASNGDQNRALSPLHQSSQFLNWCLETLTENKTFCQSHLLRQLVCSPFLTLPHSTEAQKTERRQIIFQLSWCAEAAPDFLLHRLQCMSWDRPNYAVMTNIPKSHWLKLSLFHYIQLG